MRPAVQKLEKSVPSGRARGSSVPVAAPNRKASEASVPTIIAIAVNVISGGVSHSPLAYRSSCRHRYGRSATATSAMEGSRAHCIRFHIRRNFLRKAEMAG